MFVLAVGAAVAAVALRGGGGSNAGGRTSSGPARTSPSVTAAGAHPVLRTGSAGTPTVSWAHFAAFSRLVGTRDSDSATAFDHGSCRLSGPSGLDVTLGILDEVSCTYPSDPTTITVLRLATAAKVDAYLANRLDEAGYGQFVWTAAGRPRGLALLTPKDGSGTSTLTSTFCGLPGYLVRVRAPDRTKVSTDDLRTGIWNKAPFPDALPAECDDTFRAARSGAQTSPSVSPAKGMLRMDSTVIQTLLRHSDSTAPTYQVVTPSGADAIIVGQKGTVTFFSEADDVLRTAGLSTYPYSASLGAPDAGATGSVLTGMTNATFVVRGTFSGDGSGNAVAYTNGSKGWGAIKAKSDGNLAPSGQGVGIGGVGLGDDFVLTGGRLETFDCSSQLPISRCSGNDRVIKYWTWRKTEFVQTGSAGRTR